MVKVIVHVNNGHNLTTHLSEEDLPRFLEAVGQRATGLWTFDTPIGERIAVPWASITYVKADPKK